MVCQQSSIQISNHPFLDSENHPNFRSTAYTLVGCTILHGRHIDVDVVRILSFSNEVECMLWVPPYHEVFTISKPCFEELIIKFNATYEFHGTYIAFKLRGTLCKLTMPKFGVALRLWTVDEQTTDIYTTVVQDFTKDISVYWMNVSRDGAPFVQFKAKDIELISVLWYLYAIIAYTSTGRLDSQIVYHLIE